MNLSSGSLFASAFGFSILMHLAFIGIINFENAPSEEDDEKVINIALTSEQNISPVDQDFLQPLPSRKHQEFVKDIQTIPDEVTTPVHHQPIPLQRNFEKPSDLSNPDSPVSPPPRSQPEILRSQPEIQVRPAKEISAFDKETALAPPPPLVIPPELAANSSPQQLLETTMPEKTINLDRPNQITEPVPQLESISTSPPPPTQVEAQSSPKRNQAMSADPPQSKLISPPLIAAPLTPPASPPPVAETSDSATDQNALSEPSNEFVSVARTQYVEALHNTLNKRAQRKYPRKGREKCIQGIVKARLKISPTGDQISYEITNPEETDPILYRAVEKLLEGRKGFASFSKEVASEAVTFQVNLIYILPHCQ